MTRSSRTRDCVRCSFICRIHTAPHCRSVASLRFPPLHHQLPRSHQRGIRGDWHVARPWVRRSRVRSRHRHFLPQLRGAADPWRHTGSTVERARDDLCHDDRVGIAHRAHRNRAHSRTTLPRALFVRCSRSRVLPKRHRLSEPLVYPGGPSESDEQLHGCNSCVACHRIPCGGLDT